MYLIGYLEKVPLQPVPHKLSLENDILYASTGTFKRKVQESPTYNFYT